MKSIRTMYYLICNDKVIGTYFTYPKAHRMAKLAAIEACDLVVIAKAKMVVK